VIALQTYIHTYRHTDMTECIHHAASWMVTTNTFYSRSSAVPSYSTALIIAV